MTALESLSQSRSTDEPLLLKRWTVANYHRMSELQILDPNERTELLDGQITLMVAKGTAHVLALRLVSQLLEQSLAEEAVFISTQDPILLDDFSEPEPDLAIVQGTVLDYARQHPRPEQVSLVLEVADSTVKRDCDVKDKIYAKAGIVDYWVLDLPNRKLHIFREPLESGYRQHLIVNEDQQASPLMFPDLKISVAAMMPK